MAIDRRTLLRGLGPTLAFPYLLRSESAHAALDFRLIGKPIPLGKNQPGGKRGIRLSAFDGDTYIAGWLNVRSNSDSRVFVQKRHRNGSALSQPIQMGGGPLTDGITSTGASVVAFSDGTSLVFFAAEPNGAGPPFAYDIFVQRMSASFRKIGNPIRVNAARAGAQDTVLATRLKNGNVLVVWTSPTGSGLTIRGRALTPNAQFASPERRMVRTKTGDHVPKSLGPAPNGDAMLSYVRLFNNPQAAPKAFEVQKIVQVVGQNTVLVGAFMIFEITSPDRWFGSVGTPVFDPDDEDSVNTFAAYYLKAPTVGMLAGVQRAEFSFDPPEPAKDFKIAELSVDPFLQGPPLAVLAKDANGIGHGFFWVPKTKPNLDREIWGFCVRKRQVVSKVDFFVDEPSVTVDAVAGLDGEGVLGYAAGSDPFTEQGFLQRFGTFR